MANPVSAAGQLRRQQAKTDCHQFSFAISPQRLLREPGSHHRRQPDQQQHQVLWHGQHALCCSGTIAEQEKEQREDKGAERKMGKAERKSQRFSRAITYSFISLTSIVALFFSFRMIGLTVPLWTFHHQRHVPHHHHHHKMLPLVLSLSILNECRTYLCVCACVCTCVCSSTGYCDVCWLCIQVLRSQAGWLHRQDGLSWHAKHPNPRTMEICSLYTLTLSLSLSLSLMFMLLIPLFLSLSCYAALGIYGTPQYTVNGVKVNADQTWSVNDWRQLLDPLLA